MLRLDFSPCKYFLCKKSLTVYTLIVLLFLFTQDINRNLDILQLKTVASFYLFVFLLYREYIALVPGRSSTHF